MNKKYIVWVLAVNFFVASCSISKQISRIAKNDIFQNQSFTSAHIGISIYEPETQKYWYNYQGNKFFVPASNTKLPTCYVAMKYLGDSITGMKFHESKDTLYITATGDPTFLHPDFQHQEIYGLLNNTGKIIMLNTSMWQDQRWGNGWAWNDYNDDYMAERSPMPIYGNLSNFRNSPEGVRVFPPYFANKLTTDRTQNYDDTDAVRIQRELTSNTFSIKGTDSLASSIDVPFYTNDSLLLWLLEDTLHKTIYKNYPVVQPTTDDEKEFYSQPTDSLLKIMMHRSDNFFAEQSLLMVSAKLLTVMNDVKIIDTLLKTDLKDLPQPPGWVDGSGLSRYNLFTPQDFVAILNKMKNEFGMERIKNILPTGGTGTLGSYYKDEKGFIFAKTGTLSGVVALSGFLYTRKNKLVIFSVLVNNHHDSATQIRKGIETFIKEIRNKR